jgi:acyl-CoA thioester hydrolase
MTGGGIEVWRGSTNSWDCDEMGHMNVRHYVAKAIEGAGTLASQIGMKGAFAAGATATLRPVEQHIRFHREVHAGKPIYMEAGVISVEADHVWVWQRLIHTGSGATAATYRTRFAHIEPRSGHVFAWPSRMAEALQALICDAPEDSVPRSVTLEAQPAQASLERAQALGAVAVGRGIFLPTEADMFGSVRPEIFIARVSDSVPNLMAAWREAVTARAAAGDGQARTAGAAVLEFRLLYRNWPEPGDGFEIRSGVCEVLEKTHKLAHWICDPVSGRAWATAEAVAVTFDLKTRKVIPADAQALAELRSRLIPGFSA